MISKKQECDPPCFVDDGSLFISDSDESPCPYLPGKSARSEAFYVFKLGEARYETLMGLGFRRSGCVVYRPQCHGCVECRPLRVSVEPFRPTRSMRRILNKNSDVRTSTASNHPTQEKYELYRRYLNAKHDGVMTRSYDAFKSFLHNSPMETFEFHYFLENRLIGVSVIDPSLSGLSSVYMYFDPNFAMRSLGTLSILREIEYCRTVQIPYYYLGYYVAGSRTMKYKARFRPNEILDHHGQWTPLRV